MRTDYWPGQRLAASNRIFAHGASPPLAALARDTPQIYTATRVRGAPLSLATLADARDLLASAPAISRTSRIAHNAPILAPLARELNATTR